MILIKEEFVGGEKYRRAVELGGSDVIVLWLALKCYCSQHPDTEGFIPTEVLDGLPGAPRRARKALQALIECGRMLPGGERGTGLVESAEYGWRLHDYLDHAAAPEEDELRRAKARLRKQTYRDGKRRELAAVRRLAGDLAAAGDRAGQSGDTEGDSPGDSGGNVPMGVLAGVPPREGAPTRASAHPNPSQPNQKSLRSLASTIRDLGMRPDELERSLEPCAAHRQYAAEHDLDLDQILSELAIEAGAACLSRDEIRGRIALKLELAAERRQAMGGAA